MLWVFILGLVLVFLVYFCCFTFFSW